MKKKRRCQDINHWAWIAVNKWDDNWPEYVNILNRMKAKYGENNALRAIASAHKVLQMIS